ncbi:cation diffusion facilitator family transporter [Chamaesiphon minutus]|uniref:Cation diffusion facilitator family transporter n=1 Tax=Chamaesiphon minutus (strain ATCC 27169 / PCC 6605) TaxID=1173020 RepID=K9UD67_CHAP6|nr:cation diffusion facilitator family transporter [Chamaesiphon minutus]AFY93057.1 cation diffusion facilitator family transporter [Chamaesiphon minutus PCC 6605]
MTHNHGSEHTHGTGNYNRAFIISVTLNTLFVAIEAFYGIAANSLALLADAGHNLSDVLGLLLAWGASLLSQRQATERRTFGLLRSSILAALFNAMFLLVISGGVGWEAILRFRDPAPVSGRTLIVVAAIGIVINTLSALMFLAGRKRDLNIRGAFLHLMADAAVSAGVVFAGLAIVFTGELWFDPAVSLLVTVVIVVGTWQLLRDALNLITDAVPAGIEPLAVRTYLAERPGVAEVHDLHIWSMSTTEAALMVHLLVPTGHPGDAFLAQIYRDLHENFGIEHATIQIELGDSGQACALAPENVV